MSWIKPLRIGEADVYSLTDGKFRLDGGAMFGSVPKVLWERVAPADGLNRIRLRINPLLIRLGGENILVETGFWDQGGEKFEGMYALDRDETVFRGLAEVGLTPDDISLVINTHLHFDHAGRNVTPAGEPTFPNARYVVQAQELHDATHTHERSRASYVAAYIEPLRDAGLYEVVEGEHELRPGLSVLPLPGHNLGQQGVVLRSGGQTLVYTADLVPTLAHVPYPYVMGYDLYPVTTLETRKRHYGEWFESGAILCTPHDPDVAFARLEEGKKGGFIGVALNE
ncbi:glyoxylase-like metal-dependent hydrolase (beta-lactamase superfamily II) [Deinococcus sp. HSC-46F16]|uniref:MBL fold metallo-hydrolase n=1 Tax=Deinococcus sp. HSC-46F16 TaxID=2910968 RepID=UPI0020A0EA7D|nr:MBL fold metallo-hydrolase [Deinococcus sp. HSC-46F16]MCP2013657.1 glyoxylase-like metal-dependent hydrolase (beta-lactamase superfamily II) [Deinococcus sp. HSC-46F16]